MILTCHTRCVPTTPCLYAEVTSKHVLPFCHRKLRSPPALTCMTSSYSLVPPLEMPSRVLKGAELHRDTTTCASEPCLDIHNNRGTDRRRREQHDNTDRESGILMPTGRGIELLLTVVHVSIWHLVQYSTPNKISEYFCETQGVGEKIPLPAQGIGLASSRRARQENKKRHLSPCLTNTSTGYVQSRHLHVCII